MRLRHCPSCLTRHSLAPTPSLRLRGSLRACSTVAFRGWPVLTSPFIQPTASTFQSAVWAVRRSRLPALNPEAHYCPSSPPQPVAWEKTASERWANSTGMTVSSFLGARYGNHLKTSLHLVNVSCKASLNFPLFIEPGCCCFLAGQLHCGPAGSATLEPVRITVGLVNPDQCRSCDKGKPPERVGRKAKGPNEGRMFQGQPSRHNTVLFKRHRRAGFLPEQSPLRRLQGVHPGTGLGGAL